MEYKNIEDKRFAYIVEGKTDEDKLKKLGCLYVVKTGGKYIRKEIVEFIKKLKDSRHIVLVLDPDGPGRKITTYLKEIIGDCFTVEVNKKDAIKNNKVGIAEMNLDDLKNALRPYILHDIYIDENPSFDEYTLLDLGLTGPNSKEKRKKLINKYSIPYTSIKCIEEHLLMLSITRKEIEETIND